MPVRPFAFALALVAAASGCTFDVGHLALASTHPDIPDAALTPRDDGGTRVEGRSCVWVLGVVPITRLPSLGDAVEHAVTAGGGTILYDVDVRYTVLYVPPVGRGCYVASGRAP